MEFQGLYAGPTFGWSWLFGRITPDAPGGDGGAGWGESGGQSLCSNAPWLNEYFAGQEELRGQPGQPTEQTINCPAGAPNWQQIIDAGSDLLMNNASSWGYPAGSSLSDLRPKPDFVSVSVSIDGTVGFQYECGINGFGALFFYYSPVCKPGPATGPTTNAVTVLGASGAPGGSMSVSGDIIDLLGNVAHSDGSSPYAGDPGNPDNSKLFTPADIATIDWSASGGGASFFGGGSSEIAIQAWYLTNPTSPPAGSVNFMAIV